MTSQAGYPTTGAVESFASELRTTSVMSDEQSECVARTAAHRAHL